MDKKMLEMLPSGIRKILWDNYNSAKVHILCNNQAEKSFVLEYLYKEGYRWANDKKHTDWKEDDISAKSIINDEPVYITLKYGRMGTRANRSRNLRLTYSTVPNFEGGIVIQFTDLIAVIEKHKLERANEL